MLYKAIKRLKGIFIDSEESKMFYPSVKRQASVTIGEISLTVGAEDAQSLTETLVEIMKILPLVENGGTYGN